MEEGGLEVSKNPFMFLRVFFLSKYILSAVFEVFKILIHYRISFPKNLEEGTFTLI